MKTWRLNTPRQSIVFKQSEKQQLPSVCYWGAPLPETEDLTQLVLSTNMDVAGGMLDAVPDITLSPKITTTFQGQYGNIFRRLDGASLCPDFTHTDVNVLKDKLVFVCKAASDDISIRFEITAHQSSDILEMQTRVDSKEPIFIDWLSAPVLPAPQNSTNTIEISGRWCREFQMKEVPWVSGARLRETPSGRSGHESYPGVLIPETGTTNSKGGCFGLHYGWSGGHRMITEELQDGRRQIQFGHSSDANNCPTTHKKTASLFACYSGDGLNGIAHSFQKHAREEILPFKAATRPRLVHYNCWEAVYFDHKLDELKEIAEHAQTLGAERFVLDDGWFGSPTKGRNDDTSSLGDWNIDRRKYPDGLTPLIDHINDLGMEFGLWFEPEMINPDSDLYRAHPDWILGDHNQLLGRQQMVLNLDKAEVSDYLFEKVSAILSSHKITYVKWDHNRVLPYASSKQTDGFYALLARLRQIHPDVEFESCASGGGRIDFGVLQHCQRVWLSDSNDGLERFEIQNNAAMWLPNDAVGSHVGPRLCHTSARILPMSFRAWVAASRHMGFEMDPRELTDDETHILKDVTSWYRENRVWMHQGFTHRLDTSDQSQIAEICISENGDRFVVFVGQMRTTDAIFARPTALTGLDPNARYKLSLRNPEDAHRTSRGQVALRDGPLELSGQSLMHMGIRLPLAFPATMWVVEGQKIL
ncbi:alpha-galactosidase [Lentilitoribacter sp. EG35]|uniref:alpha-galactosidase n=1 Tax=Lentilitoribacter sp. EG35 TaxID=3234192 RepID=UPI00345FEC53